MADKLTLKIVKDCLRRFPKTPTLTLAKKIYKDNRECFKDVEQVRNLIRYHRGAKGNSAKIRLKSKEFVIDTLPKNPFVIPESHAEEWKQFDIKSSMTLILSDLHIPYHDVNALKLAVKYGKDKGANCILINGDLMDFHHQSSFQKDPRARSTKEEFDATRQFLIYLRQEFPKSKIVFKMGNHDERWERWLFVKAPEIFDDPEFQLETRLKLGELGIEIVKDKMPVSIGKLTVLHGHEINGSGGVNPARGTFLKTIDNVLTGHSHRPSQHVEPTMSGDTIVTTSTGCLCGLHPMFARVNKWSHGFAFCELEVKTGEYWLDNLKIINNKVYF